MCRCKKKLLYRDRFKKKKSAPPGNPIYKHLNDSNMEEKAFRPLTLEESKKEKDQKEGRTDYERRAYRWLPDGMKKCAQRNPGVAFVGHSAYYPDLFFPEQ